MFHLSDIEHRFLYCFVEYCEISIAMFDYRGPSFARNFNWTISDVTKFQTQGCPNGTDSHTLNRFSQERKIVKQGLGHLFITFVVVLISSIKPI